MRRLLQELAAAALLLAFSPPVVADDLASLSADFWAWRAVHQPLTGDVFTRLERPPGWVPDWRAAAVEKRRTDLAGFRSRWRALAPKDTLGAPQTDRPVSETAPATSLALRVDHRLIGSALARVEWELDVRPAWRIDPGFYVAQTEGALFDLLLEPAPFSAERSAAVIARLESIPDTMFEARRNLDLLARPFAEATLRHLRNARGRLQAATSRLRPHLVEVEAERLYESTEAAIAALEGFARWLEERLPEATSETAIGPEAYDFFLREVALIPWSRDELLVRARQEAERAAAFESVERLRNRDQPEPTPFADLDEQIARSTEAELAVRAFLEDNELLDLPDRLGHYRTLPMPAYLQPLASLGVTADLTSESRLGQDAASYVTAPRPDSGYFELARASDPRPSLVHKGVPGHYAQLAISWAHENPVRRRYYDTAANGGIGLYGEEMLLQAGFFDDSPRTREVLYHSMRLRAVWAEVDVKLGTGELTVDAAADYLEGAVPMDRSAALSRAVVLASAPGQAIGCQVGKLQINRYLSEARRAQGGEFDLRRFHDRLWQNGNVPIALQRWEHLGLDDHE